MSFQRFWITIASIDTLVDVDFGLDGKYTGGKVKLF